MYIFAIFEYNNHNKRTMEVIVIMKIIYYIALTLLIIGALNWLLIGIFSFDLVATLFGEMSMLSRIVYSLVGISGLISIGLYSKIDK